MKKLIAALLIGFSANVFAIPMDNLGFESGLTGYTTAGDVSTVGGAVAVGGTVYSPTEGASMAQLTGCGVNTAQYGGTCGATMTTTLTLYAGQSFSFDWAFLGGDYIPFNDFSLFVGDTGYLLSNIATVGDYGDSGWQTFTWVAAADFSGDITWVVSNFSDTALQSTLLVDNIQTVSEPAMLALFSLGLIGLGVARRRV